ncbi:MAG: cytochrome C [Oryzomonas sp.]
MKSGMRTLQTMPMLMLAFLLIPCIALGQHSVTTDSFGDGVSKNAGCMKCHGDKKKVSGSDYIDPLKLGHTTHSRFGCSTCHDAIGTDHPNGKRVAVTTRCGDCHSDMAMEYSRSPHAANANCRDCHNPHQVAMLDEVSGDDLNKQCNKCHGINKIIASHAKWLPQADVHIAAVACATCHSGAENFVTTLYIAKKQSGRENLVPASYKELKSRAGGDNLQFLIDRNRDNYISLNELRMFNKNKVFKDLCLKSMLTPVKPTHNFSTYESRWNCTFCHASDHETMQTSYVAFPNEDGTYRQVAVERGAVIDALNAIPDFYLMGSTRNALLNKIGIVIIAGGLVMPVGHGFLRFLSRKNRT